MKLFLSSVLINYVTLGAVCVCVCVCVDNCVFLFHLNLIEIFFSKTRGTEKTSTDRIPTKSNNNNSGHSKQKRSIELANYYSQCTAFKYTHTAM